MRLTTPPLLIDTSDPFKNDALDRKQFGTSLLNLISRTDEELVICLDALWGEGKTSFVKMWQGLLEQNQIKSIYFDAFANDYIDDAFVSIVSCIINYSKRESQGDSTLLRRIDDFKETATKVGTQLLSWAAKVGIKAATLGVIEGSQLEELKGMKDEIAKSTSDSVSKFIEAKISAHDEEIRNIEQFKLVLSELASNVNHNSGKPLIIIIDELDRCKPTYAVDVIERIKHLFAVKNVTFVLSMHKRQLEESIKCLYGQNIDANTYLQKFISIICRLPKNVDDQRINDYQKYSQRLYDLHELEMQNGDDLSTSMAIIAQQFDLSLRQLEKAYAHASILYASISESTMNWKSIIAFLSIIKVINYDLFERLKKNQVSYGDFVKILNITEPSEVNRYKRILDWMKFCLYSDDEFRTSGLIKFQEELFGYSLERKDIIPFYCGHLDLVKLV